MQLPLYFTTVSHAADITPQSEVEFLVDMLRKADPPIAVQVYDTRTDEVLVI
jgi:hypothetical protein